MTKVAVIGAGTFGTAIGALLRGKGHEVNMWCYLAEDAAYINEHGHNSAFLPECDLSGVFASNDLVAVLDGVEAAILVTPSFAVRTTAHSMAPILSSETPILVLSKGIDSKTRKPFIEVLEDELGAPERLAVLSGPNHAEEIARGVKAGTVVASADTHVARFFQELLATDSFRVYTGDDPLGIGLCGAAKNPIAIACGMARGSGAGDNTIALLMTRGLAEISRLVVALGGKRESCLGLAGVGDLFVTCNSRHSRNGSYGEECARTGITVEEYEARTRMVVEGAHSVEALLDLARQHGVQMPITEAVYDVLFRGADVHESLAALIERPLTVEF